MHISRDDLKAWSIGAVCVVVGGFALYYLFVGFLYLTQWMRGHLFAEGPISMLGGLLVLVMVCLVAALPVWGICRIVNHFRPLRWKPYKLAYVITLILVGVPHYIASWQLAPLKQQFRKVASGHGSVEYTGESNDGRPVNTLNFGGSLYDIVEERNSWLARRQYLPAMYVNGKWWTDDYGPSYVMVYFYTYMPKGMYDRIMIRLFFEGKDEAYFKWLNPPPPQPKIEAPAKKAEQAPRSTPKKKRNKRSGKN